MAHGKNLEVTVLENNKTQVTETVELIVNNGALVPDNKDIYPGVNSTHNQ